MSKNDLIFANFGGTGSTTASKLFSFDVTRLYLIGFNLTSLDCVKTNGWFPPNLFFE